MIVTVYVVILQLQIKHFPILNLPSFQCLVLYGKYWISHRSKFRTYGEISNELPYINWISNFFGRNLSRLLEAPVYCSHYSS